MPLYSLWRSTRYTINMPSQTITDPQPKPVRLSNITGSIKFSMASPGPFTSLICAQGEHALICKKHRAPMLIKLHGATQWAQGQLEHTRPGPPLWSLFLIDWSEKFTPVACSRSFYRALAVLILLLHAQRIPISRIGPLWPSAIHI